MTHFFGGGYTQASFLAEVQADSGNGLSNGVMFVNNRMNLSNEDTGAVGGLDADFGPVRTATSILPNVGTTYGEDVLSGFAETWQVLVRGTTASRTASLQVGAQIGETNTLQFGALSSEALGLNQLDLLQNARVAIVHLDEALDYLNGQRAVVGAQLSRLEQTISNLQASAEATASSRSRILDADYATETAKLVRSQILQQAGSAVLAQANVQPQLVLSLLRA
jgi:flagellin